MNPLLAEAERACTRCHVIKDAIHFRPRAARAGRTSRPASREAFCEECRYQESLARSREAAHVKQAVKREIRERVRLAARAGTAYVRKGSAPRPAPAPGNLFDQFMALCFTPGADGNAPARA